MHTLGQRIATLFLIDRRPHPVPETKRELRPSLRDALALANAARPPRARGMPGHGPRSQFSNQASI